VIGLSCEGGARLALPIHNSSFEDCFRLGRNYTLTVTETVRGSELLHLTPREYLADDKNVKSKYSSPWHQARGYVSQPIPMKARTTNRTEMLERRNSEHSNAALRSRLGAAARNMTDYMLGAAGVAGVFFTVWNVTFWRP
jgi:hypothetical protein